MVSKGAEGCTGAGMDNCAVAGWASNSSVSPTIDTSAGEASGMGIRLARVRIPSYFTATTQTPHLIQEGNLWTEVPRTCKPLPNMNCMGMHSPRRRRTLSVMSQQVIAKRIEYHVPMSVSMPCDRRCQLCMRYVAARTSSGEEARKVATSNPHSEEEEEKDRGATAGVVDVSASKTNWRSSIVESRRLTTRSCSRFREA